jgi:hypothetical protein
VAEWAAERTSVAEWAGGPVSAEEWAAEPVSAAVEWPADPASAAEWPVRESPQGLASGLLADRGLLGGRGRLAQGWLADRGLLDGRGWRGQGLLGGQGSLADRDLLDGRGLIAVSPSADASSAQPSSVQVSVSTQRPDGRIGTPVMTAVGGTPVMTTVGITVAGSASGCGRDSVGVRVSSMCADPLDVIALASVHLAGAFLLSGSVPRVPARFC